MIIPFYFLGVLCAKPNVLNYDKESDIKAIKRVISTGKILIKIYPKIQRKE